MKLNVLAAMGVLWIALVGCIFIGGTRGSGEIVTEPREVRDFDSVNLATIGELRIEQGESTTLTVEADNNILPLITTEVRGDTLVVGTERNRMLRPSRTPIYTLTVPSLEEVQLGGSGDIMFSTFDADDLAIELRGSGSVDAEALTTEDLTIDLSGSGSAGIESVAANDLSVEISGSGGVAVDTLAADGLRVGISGSGGFDVAGEINQQEISISGSGGYDAADLFSQTAAATISGSGSATLRVADSLDASVSGSGSVRYHGDPEVTSSTSGSGRVTQAR